MRTIIAGSRDIEDYARVCLAVEQSGWASKITEVVSGRALGVDRLGERWAKEHGVPIKEFEVTREDWKIQGRRAGHDRNREMAHYAAAQDGALILVWDGVSTGSANMLKEAKLAGLSILVSLPEAHFEAYVPRAKQAFDINQI